LVTAKWRGCREKPHYDGSIVCLSQSCSPGLQSAKPIVQAPSLLGRAAIPTGSSFLRLRVGEEAWGAAKANALRPHTVTAASNFPRAVWVGTHNGTKQLRPMNSVSSTSVCISKLPRKSPRIMQSQQQVTSNRQECFRLSLALRPRTPSSDVSPLSTKSPTSIASTKARQKCGLVTHPPGGAGWVTNVF